MEARQHDTRSVGHGQRQWHLARTDPPEQHGAHPSLLGFRLGDGHELVVTRTLWAVTGLVDRPVAPVHTLGEGVEISGGLTGRQRGTVARGERHAEWRAAADERQREQGDGETTHQWVGMVRRSPLRRM